MQAYMNECFSYDPETGALVWKERPAGHFKNRHDANAWNAANSGNAAGWIQRQRSGQDRVVVGLDGKLYRVHGLIWILIYGRKAKRMRFVDGDGANISLKNIEELAKSEWRHPALTREYLQACFSYDADSGLLIWKERPRDHFKTLNASRRWNTEYEKKVAGGVGTDGGGMQYRMIHVCGKLRKAHRLIWFMQHGEWPKEVDHIDGDGTNNRLDNLRNVSHSENQRNQRLCKNSKTGAMGVRRRKNGKHRAWIIAEGKKIDLGTHTSKHKAIAIRKAAEVAFGYHPNHGRVVAGG